MTKPIMVQGTMSGAGKSLICTGLCRMFRQDGYEVSPFKSQNMSLNSFITREGLEMGRAQVVQAEAACVEPSVTMNPVLLKPTNDVGSQVIVMGEVVGNMSAAEYFRYKRSNLRSVVMDAYNRLAEKNDVVVIEGAGSPAEINLKSEDIVNMGMAEMANSPVILVGDIDRGGVFASIYGTIALLEDDERRRIRGIVINKFRGDKELLRPGVQMLEDLVNVPVLGVVPFLKVDIDDEDSIAEKLERRSSDRALDVAVIRLPRISNFTDFNALARCEYVGLRYVDSPEDLKTPDLMVLPGTKNTMGDLKWLRASGMEASLKERVDYGTPLIGICGGYQMLGFDIWDLDEVEDGGRIHGLKLLPVDTVFQKRKVRTRTSGRTTDVNGFFSCLSQVDFSGYEIHMGVTTLREKVQNFAILDGERSDGAVCDNVFGSYVHGLFDGELGTRLVQSLLDRKGIGWSADDFKEAGFKNSQYDILANELRRSLDIGRIYEILEAGVV